MNGGTQIKKDALYKNRTALTAKIKEGFLSVIPIVIIVMVFSLTIVPLSSDLILSFLIGAGLVILGMGLFSLGAEVAMTPIGNRIGTFLTKSKSIILILVVSFGLGFAVTLAEPDLQVLAATTPHIDFTVLLLTVGAGVGIFLVISMLRIITGIRLRWVLIVFYAVIFILAAFTEKNFLGVGFDSGGVTTGPMTVPFILALGVGVSTIRSDSRAESDSFGLIALCSIGPIIAVLLLGMFYKNGAVAGGDALKSWEHTVAIGSSYIKAIPTYIAETSLALSPIAVIFVLFQLFALKLPKRSFLKITLGVLYTFVGLVLFLTGVHVGFASLGEVLGKSVAEGGKVLLFILALLLGWFIVAAEPAVVVLEKQIEDVSSGAIPGKAVKLSLSVAIAAAMGLSVLRVLLGISILWFLVPGYTIALILAFFVPDVYTAIAFDSGGVASGPMTATFMLRFIIGVTQAAGGNILQDAFGMVAMVAMTPLISVQVMGLIYGRVKKKAKVPAIKEPELDQNVIELWVDRSEK